MPLRYSLFDAIPQLDLDFKEAPIQMRDVTDYLGREIVSKVVRLLWDNRQRGDTDQSDANKRLFGKESNFGQSYVYQDKVCPTLTGKDTSLIHFDKPKILSQSEVCSVSTFPQDYNFAEQSPHYICGMSVPPVMMAHIASAVYEQWLSKIG